MRQEYFKLVYHLNPTVTKIDKLNRKSFRLYVSFPDSEEPFVLTSSEFEVMLKSLKGYCIVHMELLAWCVVNVPRRTKLGSVLAWGLHNGKLQKRYKGES